MSNPTESLRDKLLILSKQKNIRFQDFLNRFGAEQFLRRLSQSKHNKNFIFKGGFLLAYRLESTRETKDLDFSVRKDDLDNFKKIFQEIISIAFDDYLIWETPKIQELAVPDMPYPGVRLSCKFCLGKAIGSMQIDVAAGDFVKAEKISLQSIRYRNHPLVGDNFEVYVYPLETVFAEKIQIAITKGSANSRMKDFYDLYLISQSSTLDGQKLMKSIGSTFKNRGLTPVYKIDFDEKDILKLQVSWTRFIKSQEFSNVPGEISNVIRVINQRLKELDLNK